MNLHKLATLFFSTKSVIVFCPSVAFNISGGKTDIISVIKDIGTYTACVKGIVVSTAKVNSHRLAPMFKIVRFGYADIAADAFVESCTFGFGLFVPASEIAYIFFSVSDKLNTAIT